MGYLKQLFEELKRRNIYKVAVAYGITGWVIVQIAAIATGAFGAPDWVMKMLITVVLLGFPVAVILAWAFEITPDGIRRTKEVPIPESNAAQISKKLNYWIICLLSATVLFLLTDKFWMANSSTAPRVDQAGMTMPSVAVLPFEDFSKEGNQEWFADGLTEEILNSLARLQGLKVAARTSSFHFKNTNIPIQQIADTLRVENIVEGSVRRAGDDMRITVQLIRAEDGFHLWSKTYKLKVDDVFEVQENISENIAAALDIYLDEQKRKRMFAYGTRNVDAYEAYLKGRNIYDELHASNLESKIANELFNRAAPWFKEAIQLDPNFAAPYYYLSDPYVHYILDYPDSKNDTLTVEKAKERMLYNLAQAISHTKDPGLRLMYRFERTFLSDNWNPIPKLVQQLKKSPQAHRAYSMLGGGWTRTFLNVAGYAKLQYQLSSKALQRDPFNLGFRVSVLQALLSMGKTNHFLAAIDSLNRIISTNDDAISRSNGAKFFMLVRASRFDKADSLIQVVETPFGEPATLPSHPLNIFLQAVRGNTEQAGENFKKFSNEGFKNSYKSAIVHYAVGNVKKANSLAARIDTTAFGPLKLLMASAVDISGFFPFHLEATPNLAARLREANVEIRPVQWGHIAFLHILQKEL